jgi:hypothetical protein
MVGMAKMWEASGEPRDSLLAVNVRGALQDNLEKV